MDPDTSFVPEDFVHCNSKTMISENDIKAYLQAYKTDLETGVSQEATSCLFRVFEEKLTPRGLKKLTDMKSTLRYLHEKHKTELEKQDQIPCTDASSEYHIMNISPEHFVTLLQTWGQDDQDSPKYYLHMVFRFYMVDYHKYLVQKDRVVDTPSYQFVLDSIYPSESVSKFPPEFRNFLRTVEGRSVVTAITPVPVKGNAKDICWRNNHENLRDVSICRRRIERTIADWKHNDLCVYPAYLSKERAISTFVKTQILFAKEIGQVKKKLLELHGHPLLAKLDALLKRYPHSKNMYESYMSTGFKNQGEQLKERFDRIMRADIRWIFIACYEFDIHMDLANTVVSSRQYTFDKSAWTRYCSTLKVKIRFGTVTARHLTLLVESILFLLECYGKRHMCSADEKIGVYSALTTAIKRTC